MHNDIVWKTRHGPETHRPSCQVVVDMPGLRGGSKKATRRINLRFHSVCCFNVVLGDIGPYGEQVILGLRGEEIRTHAARCCSLQARFLSCI